MRAFYLVLHLLREKIVSLIPLFLFLGLQRPAWFEHAVRRIFEVDEQRKQTMIEQLRAAQREALQEKRAELDTARRAHREMVQAAFDARNEQIADIRKQAREQAEKDVQKKRALRENIRADARTKLREQREKFESMVAEVAQQQYERARNRPREVETQIDNIVRDISVQMRQQGIYDQNDADIRRELLQHKPEIQRALNDARNESNKSLQDLKREVRPEIENAIRAQNDGKLPTDRTEDEIFQKIVEANDLAEALVEKSVDDVVDEQEQEAIAADPQVAELLRYKNIREVAQEVERALIEQAVSSGEVTEAQARETVEKLSGREESSEDVEEAEL